ncbi:hypothetical protein C8R44DRAFT_824903 [Mycena epipterygia]|nr:hypothetical protein C8R44DRAFT_824903 [Mycena epipterygia]
MRPRRRRARHGPQRAHYAALPIHLAHAILPLRRDRVMLLASMFFTPADTPSPSPSSSSASARPHARSPPFPPSLATTTTPLLRKTQRSPAPRLYTHTRIPPRLPPYFLLPRLPHPSNLLPPVQTPTPPRTSKTRTSTHRTDWPGALLPAAGLVLLVFVLGQGAGPGVPPPRMGMFGPARRDVPAFGARYVPGVLQRMGMQARRNGVNMWKVVTRAFVPPPDREFDFDDFDADEFDGEFAAFDDLGMPSSVYSFFRLSFSFSLAIVPFVLGFISTTFRPVLRNPSLLPPYFAPHSLFFSFLLPRPLPLNPPFFLLSGVRRKHMLPSSGPADASE